MLDWGPWVILGLMAVLVLIYIRVSWKIERSQEEKWKKAMRVADRLLRRSQRAEEKTDQVLASTQHLQHTMVELQRQLGISVQGGPLKGREGMEFLFDESKLTTYPAKIELVRTSTGST